MPWTLDGYAFPAGEEPAYGPLVEIALQRWTKQSALGSVDPGSVLTFIGFESQEWEFRVQRAVTATKDKLIAVYNGQAAVTLITPQNATGFAVMMTALRVEHREPQSESRFDCIFTLVKR